MDRGQDTNKKVHPRETANVLSRLSFFYTINLFIKGYKSSLESKDLYNVLNSCRSKELGDQLEDQWQIEKKKNKASICRALWSCFGKPFMVLGFMEFVIKMITTIWLPEALSKLISYFSSGQTELTKSDAIYYASVVVGVTTVNLFFYHNLALALTELGIKVKTAISSLIYRKTLRLSCEALSDVTTGKITTIITKDVDAFEVLISIGSEIWISLVQTGVTCYLIYCKMGVSSFTGITFFVIILPVQVLIGKMSYTLRLQSSKRTDERLELLQEILSAIKIIKMYTWEKYFERKINLARKAELKKIQELFYTKIWIVVIGSISFKIAFFILLMTYVWMGNTLTAEVAYYVLSCFYQLEYSFSDSIPSGISYAAEAYATVKRIEEVLKAKETPQHHENRITDKPPQIKFTGVTNEICGKTVIKDVSLTINEGLYIVTGHVGCGKTALLKTILKDCQIKGDVQVMGTISYASQDPWLFPSTIKNNILFRENYDEHRYREVIKICNLQQDLEMMLDGDNTIVGDRGINLSKGQQARINLARAVYKQSDIYLLDDCLASLDAHVSDSIFQECIKKFMKNKICICVSNNYDYIQQADQIISVNMGSVEINKNGSCTLQQINNFINNPEAEINHEISEECTTRKEVYGENKQSGKVSTKTYQKYISYGGGMFVFSLIMSVFIATQGAASYSEKALSKWITLEQNLSSIGENSTNEYDIIYEEKMLHFSLYTAVATSAIILTLVQYLAFFMFTRKASVNIHNAMVHNVINSTMNFFDSTFVGNVLNRFSKDCVVVDEHLPFNLIDCLTMIFVACGAIILLTSVSVIFLIESLVLIVITYLLKIFYQPTGRNLQRLSALTRSPLIGHLNSTMEGLTTIRASKAEEIVASEFDRHQNLAISANYCLQNSTRALSFALDLFCTIFIALIIVQFLVIDLDTTVGDVGLAISEAFAITDIIVIGIKNLSMCENKMTCVERILEYTELKEEQSNGTALSGWPQQGLISFNHVSLSYNDTPQKVLNNISIVLRPKEKLGIVGRTGSGKSSIIAGLFRLYEIDGEITIDGVDINTVPLRCLRANLAVIPQDPFLFSGTLRQNLDPYNDVPDERIWKILGELQLKSLVPDLNMELHKSSSFSMGQRQLLCLARAILRNSQIVILDEATANVDQDTDSLIHATVQKYFSQCTVIIIAHRLMSILNCQRVVVMDKGRISEYGEPMNLLNNQNSFLHHVIK